MSDLPIQSSGLGVASVGQRSRQSPIRHAVLLAGAVGAKSLAVRLGRSILDLPLETGVSLLDVWTVRLEESKGCSASGWPAPDVLVLAGQTDPLPMGANAGPEGHHAGQPRLRAARDTHGYRGTAGALRDLFAAFGAEDYVLVGTASQCPDAGLIAQLVADADPSAGVTLSADAVGAPSGLMLIRCGALREVASVGYIDLKEQALPRIASTAGVRVIRCQGGVSPAIRDLRTYLDAVHSWHRSESVRGAAVLDPFEERWRPTFAVVEPGAQVATGARIHDSVVLAGARVEAGAQVVRSVVGAGGVVRRRSRVLDQLVVGPERIRSSDAPAGASA